MNDPYQLLGVDESASDEEVKKAYFNLARKYHPDNYHGNPLADLAEEKMKEINAAYEEITRRRQGGGSRSGGYGGYGAYGGAAQSSNPLFQQVRLAIRLGDLSRAETLLSGAPDHNGEWNFLKGTLCYRRGWVDEARRYYETAVQMEPGNQEYRQALEYLTNTGSMYSPRGAFGTDLCGATPCAQLCCNYLLCSSCGPVFCCL